MQAPVVRRRLALPNPGAEVGLTSSEELERAGLWSRLRQFFAHDKLVNALMVTSIIIGFFHGWLKIRFRSGWVTFAFDIPLTLAWIVTVLSVGRGRRLFPDCNMSKVLIALTLVGSAYTILPFGVPPLIALASFRAWCFIPLIFLIGYHITRSVRQVEVYLWLLTVLAVITAIYGCFFQSMAEVLELMKNDPDLQFRLIGQFYAGAGEGSTFRRFSTFVSSASFGGMMAYCATFAVFRLAHAGCSWWERVFLAAASAIMVYAIVLSGARSALSSLLVGLAFAAWYRRGVLLVAMVPLLVVGGLALGVSTLGHTVLNRFGTLLDPSVLLDRLYIVFRPGWDSLVEHPFGGGLGRSGHGVPVIMYEMTDGMEVRSIDGDMGRIAVDMGIIGLILFGVLGYVGMTDSFRWMNKLRNSPLGVIGLPAGCMFILALLQLTYGSPFLGIPGGVLLWFFLGAMRRLVEDYEKYQAAAGDEGAALAPQFVSFISPERLQPLFQTRPQTGSRVRGAFTVRGRAKKSARTAGFGKSSTKTVRPPVQVVAQGNLAGGTGAPIKRFLFRRSSDASNQRGRR